MIKSEFLIQAQERGFFHQCTNLEGLDQALNSKVITAYIGFDCTAKSLHVGSLVQIMFLRLLQKYGHQPIVLMGGGTTKIGDPSGRDETRQILTPEIIEDNKNSMAKVFKKFIKFGSGATDSFMLDNAEWLDKLNYIEFLRDIGKHFTINKMLSFDSVKMRLDREQPLTFIEFNYMLLQSYDFVELSKRYKCTLQIGGSDQWGNIVNGADLGRRLGTEELFGLTLPLITTKSGAKMGKTASGAIWLNEEMLPNFDYWQFWRNTEDGDVEKFLYLFTELPADEIKRLGQLQGKELNDAKIILANEATKLCRGENAAMQAHETAIKTFEQGLSGGDLPVFEVESAELTAGIAAFKLFVICGLCDSNGAARRLIQGKGAKLNNIAIDDENYIISLADMNDSKEIKLSFGQKKHMVIKEK